jgi:nucleotide-binding universal stress UspA family protein
MGSTTVHRSAGEANVPYKDIVVYLDASPYLETRLEVATAFAQQHGAKLIGVDVSTQAAFEGAWREQAVEIPERFEAAAKARDIPFKYHVAGRESASGLFVHASDLFVATQPHIDTAHLAFDGAPERVLLTGGVPGLILPCYWQKRELGKRVIVAWNASREATRALHDSLPILERAEVVTIFAFERHYDAKRADMERLVAHLENHGVRARVDPWPDTGEIDMINALFSSLDEDDIDLIVAGAYGHSRWLENLVGGASRDLIRQETMAVLLSH